MHLLALLLDASYGGAKNAPVRICVVSRNLCRYTYKMHVFPLVTPSVWYGYFVFMCSHCFVSNILRGRPGPRSSPQNYLTPSARQERRQVALDVASAIVCVTKPTWNMKRRLEGQQEQERRREQQRKQHHFRSIGRGVDWKKHGGKRR